jgi:hypothetical protein
MAFKPVLKLFEERKHKLMETLKNFEKGQDLELQHQVYGAICELDLVMKTLQTHQDKLMREAQGLSPKDLSREDLKVENERLDGFYRDLQNNRYQ